MWLQRKRQTQPSPVPAGSAAVAALAHTPLDQSSYWWAAAVLVVMGAGHYWPFLLALWATLNIDRIPLA